MKKLLSLILALVMCALPMLSVAEAGVIGGADGPTDIILSGPSFVLPSDFAEDAIAAGRKGISYLTVTEMTGISTGDAEMDAALTDLVKALGIYGSEQGDESEFAITISDVDVLNLGVAVNGSDAYMKSNLLGDTIVVGAEEVELLVNRLLDMLVMMEAVTDDDAAMLKEQVAMLSTTISAVIENSVMEELTTEDLLALDYSAIMSVMSTVLGKVQPIENPVVPKNCDAVTGGVSLNVTNDDMLAIMKSFIQFLKDNPKLTDYVASMFGISSEAYLAGMWDALKDSGMYASEEEFREYNAPLTQEQMLEEALAALEGSKVLDGDYVIQYYYDEVGLPVYVTCTLPMYTEIESLYTEDEASAVEAKGETTIVEVVYARQNVAQGVSHVANISVDGETLTVDTLVSGNSAHIVLSVPEEEPIVIDVTVEGNAMTAMMTCNPSESTAITCTVEGSYLCTETDYALTGKLTFTEVYTPAETETPSVNGLTLPGYEANKPKAHTNTLEVSFNTDYDRIGVDFSGVTDIVVAYNDVRIGLQAKSWTTDPVDSIMSGEVVRPAELDDAAFTNWFVGVVNNFGSWAGNLMMALPESLLTLLLQSGMI